MYPKYAKGADILGYDIYPVNYQLPLSTLSVGLENLKKWSGGNKPILAYIETTGFGNSGDGKIGGTPSPAQIKQEVWQAIVHGARGIVYFVHIFSPTFNEAGLLADPVRSNAVSDINAQVRALAPIINGPTVTSDLHITSTTRVDSMVKNDGKARYVFAVEMKGASASASFKLSDVSGATVTVVGENRTLPMSNGSFTDSFEAYGVHIYKII
jgi:hypothetical protein